MEETIDLREIFTILKKRMWIIAIITSVFVVVSIGLSFFILKPVYEANTTLIVNTDTDKKKDDILTGDQVIVTEKLAITYGEIIKSRTVLEPIIKDLGLNMTYDELYECVQVAPVKNTQIINISVNSKIPKQARDIANAIPTVFKGEVKRITKANGIEVIDRAITPDDPIKPKKLLNVSISAVLGVMVGLFVVFLIEYLDNKVKTPQDVEKYLELPLIGVIPLER
ncbi:YveK family protein [Asaccharospora irregularis]|uniref:Capsular polysaccharide biosynthesis protein n=1 Tax=Asaccharospora irregularis DSM 2635 TaxID=1121321 RepID=A0A1M5M7R1_9FIRM|nr:Wzz/FepE/Etk N-terminal domain-containing protein [Asaccharospora irregularis]SHG73302.1 Capsular polysaccharide biosynthesis protein [Asaccharospora irregularis DSM 2635]